MTPSNRPRGKSCRRQGEVIIGMFRCPLFRGPFIVSLYALIIS